MIVPYLDIARMHKDIKNELIFQFREALESSDFILGASVERFEAEFAVFSNAEYCVGVSSGTSAIQLTLESLGVGQGDEVIVPANSFTATAAAAARTGAKVVFADVDPISRLLTPGGILPNINRNTRAIIPVHLHGNVADAESISQVAGKDIWVIEDAAQAHGASYFSRPIGAFSSAATYSFYPGKNLGALGDAGAVTTKDPELAENLRQLRNWGEISTKGRRALGYNERLDALQARFLTVKLLHMPNWEMRRRQIAKMYSERLSGNVHVKLPDDSNFGRVWHVYAIEVDNRDFVREQLIREGIETKIHYASIIPEQLPYSMDSHGIYPVAQLIASKQLSLPLDPFMTESDVDYVVSSLERILRN